MAKSAYVHIPFCTHKCDFCDFAAYAGMSHLEDEYTKILVREIAERPLNSQCEPLQTVFYGGGTPGLISTQNLALIHEALEKRLGINASAEVTLETTPHAITAEKIAFWRQMGVNRLSIGVETLMDSELTAVGRDHTREQAFQGVELACASGMELVSLDFMYSLPTQTVESFRQSLTEACRLAERYPAIKHISAYGLMIAEQSPLYARFPKDSPSYPPDDTFSEMYRTLVEVLESQGFAQYEISNFAKPGSESQHNLTYWLNQEYQAYGVSAHRFVSSVRSANFRALKRYMADCLTNESEELIEGQVRVREALMLGLRLRRGIDLGNFHRDYGLDLSTHFARPLDKLISGGFLEFDCGRLRLTQQAIPVSNSVIAEFF